jgi:peptide/nickel transport system ATP-binding protein
MTDADTLLEVNDLKVHFPAGRSGGPFGQKLTVHAVDGVSFRVPRRTTFGIVGESGSGKSTAAQAIMRLVPVTNGNITLGGQDITALRGKALQQARRHFQMIFQDPYSALNPRRRAGDLIREPLDLLGVGTPADREARLQDLLAAVGLPPEAARLFPHQFSGGQRQRLVIARALSTRPDLIVCDEPVSALDVAIQAQILNLLKRLQRDLGLTYVFISHDLGVVQHLCDQVAVMYLGRIVELAPADRLFAAPRHPYTWSLIAAASPPGRQRMLLKQSFALQGEPPSPINPPPGCRFAARCPFAVERCRQETPQLSVNQSGHFVACHRAEDVVAVGDKIMAAA